MGKKFYLSTPLYYVNAKPHIGHAYTTIAADALARFKRMIGCDVFFLTGTDEHGQKIERASNAAGMTPKDFADKLSGSFKELWRLLDISYDGYIRTTEERHIRAVEHIWRELEKKELIYTKKYEGWYCTPCETFLPYRELASGGETKTHCPQCSRALEEITEENFFFAISRFQDWLIKEIIDRPDFIQPESRRNETLAFLKGQELLDLCISRPRARLKWGITCPLSEGHVTYVWFDALINYISGCGYPDLKGSFSECWPCDVHLIGKDILRPHTVYWPIMLKALEIELPRRVFAHGWWMQDKTKMSKSLGNVVDPINVTREYGVDAMRYFLLREAPFGEDGVYSDEAMTLRYNTDLANDLGNLFHRTLTMMEKYFDGIIHKEGARDAENVLRESLAGLAHRMDKAMERLRYQEALTELWKTVNASNKFIEDLAPWKLFKEKKTNELTEGMVSLCEALRVIAQGLWPFMPATARALWESLGLKAQDLVSDTFVNTEWNYFKQDSRVKKGQPLFPRRDSADSDSGRGPAGRGEILTGL